MKKYSSGSFVDAALRVYKSEADTISSFPATIITNGGNITPWTIYGNTSAGQSVGEKTENLFNGFIEVGGLDSTTGEEVADANRRRSDFIEIESSTSYNFSRTMTATTSNLWVLFYDNNKDYITGSNKGTANPNFTEESPATAKYVRWYVTANGSYDDMMIIEGSTTPSSYIPYGYKLPVVIGSNTTNIYVADVLRMSSGADPVYDIMSSTGVITRNVDTDGSPLPTPTTESFTAPTLATVAGSQSFNIDTTVKPSSVSLTYTGWHTHADKQYSGGSWGALTSGQILRRKKTTKRKT